MFLAHIFVEISIFFKSKSNFTIFLSIEIEITKFQLLCPRLYVK